MRLVSDKPRGLQGNFVLMGIVKDDIKEYACLFDTGNGKTYVEEIWWAMNVKGNEASANLKAIDNDEEWQIVYNFVTKSTTIFSPKKLRMVLNTAKHRNVVQLDPALKSNLFPYVNREVDETKKHQVVEERSFGSKA